MPMKFGISQEISAPLASLVQHTGTRASKIAPRSAISSCVMSTVPSMAMAMSFRLERTMVRIWNRCNSWKFF